MIGLEPGSIETIHNGVPDVSLNPVPRPAEGPIVGAVGRLSPRRASTSWFAPCALLPPDVTCVLVGDGPLRGDLERLAASLGVGDRVIVTGWVEQARDYLPVLDVVAMPSRFEGFPLAAVEAMLASRPLVATPVQSIPEAVEDGITGLLVPPEDPDALAGAVAELLGDHARREEMGRLGRALALERFTSQTMARSYEALYRRLLSRAVSAVLAMRRDPPAQVLDRLSSEGGQLAPAQHRHRAAGASSARPGCFAARRTVDPASTADPHLRFARTRPSALRVPKAGPIRVGREETPLSTDPVHRFVSSTTSLPPRPRRRPA